MAETQLLSSKSDLLSTRQKNVYGVLCYPNEGHSYVTFHKFKWWSEAIIIHVLCSRKNLLAFPGLKNNYLIMYKGTGKNTVKIRMI